MGGLQDGRKIFAAFENITETKQYSLSWDAINLFPRYLLLKVPSGHFLYPFRIKNHLALIPKFFRGGGKKKPKKPLTFRHSRKPISQTEK